MKMEKFIGRTVEPIYLGRDNRITQRGWVPCGFRCVEWESHC